MNAKEFRGENKDFREPERSVHKVREHRKHRKDLFAARKSQADTLKMEGWQSGQLHQTVNLASSDYAGSNPAPSTI